MKKFLLRYFIFWLPAVLVSYFYNNTSVASQAMQWIFAALMVMGWAVNTGMCAYRFPRTTFSLILFYIGFSIFSVTLQYSVRGGTRLYPIVRNYGGIFSFRPLDILVVALLDFDIPQEVYVIGVLVVLCLVGYLIGLLYRRIQPNPYRPRIIK